MKRIFWLAGVWLAVTLAATGAAFAAPTPSVRPALDFGDPNVVNYGARVRLTKSTWDYLRLTLRDTFALWAPPNGVANWDPNAKNGANLLLDPGYDENKFSAGPIRTTPLELWYGNWDSIDRPDNGNADWYDGCIAFCCGQICTWAGCVYTLPCKGNTVYCYGCNVGTGANNSGWIQVRRPGFNTGDRPGVPYPLNGYPSLSQTLTNQAGFREFGFFVADAGKDYKEFEVCTGYYSGSADLNNGGYNGSSNPCAGSSMSVAGLVNLDYHARILIFANTYKESQKDPSEVAAGYASPFQPTQGLGGHSGWGTSTYLLGTYSSCWNTYSCTGCNTAYCSGGGGSVNTYYRVPYVPASGSVGGYGAGYNPASNYDKTYGTFFRQGDDTAVYTNIKEMQIQSANRASEISNGCGTDLVYSRQLASGKPNYYLANVQNCLRPKAYVWTNPSNGLKYWKQCNPFDTWNADGTYNTSGNDDNKVIYPGVGYTTRTCSAQPCSTTDIFGNAQGWAHCGDALIQNRRTANVFLPGGGWYLLSTESVNLVPGSNRIDIVLAGKDLVLEAGAYFDLHFCDALTGWICGSFSDKWFEGIIQLNKLTVNASLSLYAIDNYSCGETAGGCSGFWHNLKDGINRPDFLTADVQISSVTVDWKTSPSPAPFDGECNSIDLLGIISIDVCWILNLVYSFLTDPLTGAIKDAISPFITDFVGNIPNLSTVLGDPVILNTALIQAGVFATGNNGNFTDTGVAVGTPQKRPIYVKSNGVANHELVDMRLSVGFKPIAFLATPSCLTGSGNAVCTIDTANPPAASSIFGVPTLMDEDLTGCSTATCASSYPGPYPHPDTDQEYDFDAYVKAGSWYAPHVGLTINANERIPEYWKGPIRADKKSPDWCMTVPGSATKGPRQLMNGAMGANFKTLYPQNKWLSFDAAQDTRPSGGTLTGFANSGKNAIGDWDTLPGAYVPLLNSNIPGQTEAAPVSYDFSMHIHQQMLNEFVQAMFASGIGCLEFAQKDTMNADTPWKGFLNTSSFSAFLPDISVMYPNQYAKVRIMPMMTPHVRVGAGTATFMPSVWKSDANCYPVTNASCGKPQPIGPAPYTLGIAVPNMRIDIIIEDTNTHTDVPVFTMYWNTVAGFYMKSVRKCLPLDPLSGTPQCTSPYTNVRTVSGYYEMFLDLNSPSLQAQFENNGKDGFPVGMFSDPGVGFTTTQSAFNVTYSLCNAMPAKCKKLALANSVPSLLNSLISMFVVSRFNFENLTLDFMYVGPDGPNDDNIPAAAPGGANGGDYLGIYTRFMGNLNVLELISMIGGLAPPNDTSFLPSSKIVDALDSQFVNTYTPTFKIATATGGHTENSVLGYTYRVDSGFWHSPVDYTDLKLEPMLEGNHKLEIRSIEDSPQGAYAQVVPTVLKFTVDTVPPDLAILPSDEGIYRKAARVTVSDIQTPREQLDVAYSIDGGEWKPFEGSSISLRSLEDGKHVLRVKATDLAGNTSEAAREISYKPKGWGCAAANPDDMSPWLVALLLAFLGFRGSWKRAS